MQEPGTNEEILEFVKKFDEKMAEKLVFFEKADVNGASTREVYSFLKGKLPNEDGTADVRWNFGEYGEAFGRRYGFHPCFSSPTVLVF